MSTEKELNWPKLIERSLNGQGISRQDAKAVLALPDENVLGLIDAAFVVRKARWGKRVKICVLQNARSGLCSEDCRYCSQSSVSTAKIDKYPLLSLEQLVEGARKAALACATRYCMVTSGRAPSDEDIERFCEAAQAIRQDLSLELCVSVGLVSDEQARRLKSSGIGWVNHNLNTSERHHSEVCSTHSYQDRVNTVRHIRAAGLKTCSGGIIGMGETDEDLIDLAYAAREFHMDAIPINFLHPIKGTPMETLNLLSPMRCLKTMCLFRFLNPDSEIRAAGGREVNLRSLQPLALYPANSIFVEGYLTTPGQQADEARKMIEDIGFEVEVIEFEVSSS